MMIDYKILANGGTISDKESLELNESLYDGDYTQTLQALGRLIELGLKSPKVFGGLYKEIR